MDIELNKEYRIIGRRFAGGMFTARVLKSNSRKNKFFCEWCVYDPDTDSIFNDSGWISKRKFICKKGEPK